MILVSKKNEFLQVLIFEFSGYKLNGSICFGGTGNDVL